MAKKPTVDQKNTVQEEVSRAPRSTPMASAAYRNPNDLTFPSKMIEFYERKGYTLRWVAVIDVKTRSFTNGRINYFLSMGGELLTPKEVKEIDPSFLSGLTKYDYREDFADEDDRARGSSTGIRKDDLVAMKIPLAYKEQKQNLNRQLVAEQLAAAEQKHLERGLDIHQNAHGSANVRLKPGFFSK